jgi:TPR repeat protein
VNGPDLDRAVYYFQLCASQGYAQAQNALAMRYLRGEGVPQSDADAFEQWLLASRQGLRTAMANVASCYRDGEGCSQDFDAAIHWYEEAFRLGDEDAARRLERVREMKSQALRRQRRHDERKKRLLLPNDDATPTAANG